MHDATCSQTYLEEIDDHVPLAPITDEVVRLRQEKNQPVIERFFCILDREFKVVIRLVEFIPEEQVWL